MPSASDVRAHLARLRARYGSRTLGIVLALLLEGMLALVLLTLRPGDTPRDESRPTPVFTLDAEPESEAEPEASPDSPPEPSRSEPSPAEPAPTPPRAAETPVTPPPPRITVPRLPAAPPFIPLSRQDMAKAEIAPRPAPAPAAPPARRAPMGPPDTGGNPAWADTERVGTAPNGEPLYAAAWYREPYDSELRGYLSTASGPGWALIACRTVPDWRVEDCVSLGESPSGSNIARAVLAAAWQFKVRPPRLGGESKVGEWVRIRIDYGIAPRRR